MRFFEIVDQVLEYHPEADTTLLERAYVFSAKVHRGAARLPGEYYLQHPLEVAAILTRLHLDDQSIVAGLLHDVLEEKLSTGEELQGLFGPRVVAIIEGVTRLSRIEYEIHGEHQAEHLRKMVLAMTKDLRVILVRLADRLHDLRVFQLHPAVQHEPMANEVFDIYAPLAGRLGIEWMKMELEELAFQCRNPQAYARISQGLAKTEQERSTYIEEVKQTLTAKLTEYGLNGRVSGRSKHIYSIYRKMMAQHLELDRIYDLTAFRIIVDSLEACYQTLGIVHAAWEPVPGRYKDYITKPKPNMYQSLHTTVIGPYGERMEVQIRTQDMDRVAREGIAAHWFYKEANRQNGRKDKALEGIDEQEVQRFSWLRQLLEPEKGWSNPKEFFETVKVDLYPDEVYVFSPQGEVKVLPRGATPIDFAYHVHTMVGHRCVGARVNGKIVPLRSELGNGDTVEILTATKHHPSKDWLNFVKTNKAKNRIRHWIKTEERDSSIALGRDTCEREFRKRGLNFNHYLNSQELQEIAKSFSLQSVDDLLAAVGYKKISAMQVVGRIEAVQPAEEPAREDLPVERKRRPSADDGILVQGIDDVLVRMARCCNPIPGEAIVGYVTRGRGITVHRRSCKNVTREERERQIDVCWDSGEEQSFPARVRVVYDGDKGGLGILSALLGQYDVTVSDVTMNETMNGLVVCRMRIEVRDTEHLNRVLSALKNEKTVHEVQRVND